MSISSKLLYELNPPKLLTNDQFDKINLDVQMRGFIEKASSALEFVSGLHITDSVLGFPRVSSVTAASVLRNAGIETKLSCSLRTSDRNLISIFQFMSEAIQNKVQGVLILKGDPPYWGPDLPTLKASEVIKALSRYRINEEIELYLSSPNRIINNRSFNNKLKSKPHALITQSISSISDLSNIIGFAKPYGINIIPCIMCPSERNLSSAQKIGLDWSSYSSNPLKFIKEAATISHKVLLSSPNSFNDGLELMKSLKEISL
jgi:5,10-methylenetetrahydrofolate reductase